MSSTDSDENSGKFIKKVVKIGIFNFDLIKL